MSNIIAQLTARIEEYRAENKNPCKNYATEAAAEKALSEASTQAGVYFDKDAQPARYVVFYNQAWNRWVGAMDYTELFSRKTFTGGYIGAVKGFYTY
jgi:hypothetical protein